MKTNLERSHGVEIAYLDDEQQRPRENSSSLAQQKESRKVGEPVLTCSNSVAEDEAERRPNTLMQIIDDVVS